MLAFIGRGAGDALHVGCGEGQISRALKESGADSLTHALEAHVSKRANPFSDALAVSAMALIGGLSNAMLLPAVTRFSVSGAEARYAEAARRIGLAGESDPDAAACARLVAGLEALNAALSVPSPAAFGIEEDAWNAKVELMAEQALASGSPANNPRVPSKGEIVGLYREVWVGAARNV